MEQQLINALMKLLAKAGGKSLIRDLVRESDENGNPKVWTESELQKAVQYVNWQNENFGAADAFVIIDTLVKQYHLRPENLSAEGPAGEPSGVQGLQ